MKVRHFHATLSGLLLLAAGIVPAQVIFTSDFETDQSAAFTVLEGRTLNSDVAVDFNFDYSTYAAAYTGANVPPTPTSIPQAPNTPGVVSTRRGVKLQANIADTSTGASELNAVTLFFNDPLAANLSDFELTMDVFSVFPGLGDLNGGTASGTGTTIFFGAGYSANMASAYWPTTASDATFAAMDAVFTGVTIDGGSGTDYRLYTASTQSGGTGVPSLESAVANWHGLAAAAINGANAAWTALFTNPAYEQAGSPGKEWSTWEFIKDGTTISIYATPAAGTQAGVRTLVSTFQTTASAKVLPTSGVVGITLFDIFSSVPLFPNDTFILIDNVTLEVPVAPLATEQWQLFE